jgi:hypothetical protein
MQAVLALHAAVPKAVRVGACDSAVAGIFKAAACMQLRPPALFQPRCPCLHAMTNQTIPCVNQQPQNTHETSAAAALAQHVAFVIQQVSLGRAAAGSLFAELTTLLLAPGDRGGGMHDLLVGALDALITSEAQAPPPAGHHAQTATLCAPHAAGPKAVSLIAAGAAGALAQQGGGAGGEAAGAAGARLLLAVAQRQQGVAAAWFGGRNLAALLLSELHAPLLAHPKAAMRKLLLDLAAAVLATEMSSGSGAAAHAQQAVQLLSCMTADKDATVRTKALALLPAAAPLLAQAFHAAACAAEEDQGSGAVRQLERAVLPRLADSSKTARRAAVQLLVAAASAAAGDLSVAEAATALLRAAFEPLTVLADAPPASPAHDPPCQEAARQLLQQLPRLVGVRSTLDLLQACNSDAGCSSLIDAVLAFSWEGAAAGVYAEWAAALRVMPRQQVARLSSICGQLPKAAAAGRALERLRRDAFSALASELAAHAAEPAPHAGGDAAVGDQTLEPAAAARLAGAARVLAVAGGLCSARGSDAAGEAAILMDVLAVLLAARQASHTGGGDAAVAASCEDGIGWALEVAAQGARGALRPHIARVLRGPLLTQLQKIESCCPIGCIDLALQALCDCCPGQQLQALLLKLEQRVTAPTPAISPTPAVLGGCSPRALAAYLILLRRLAEQYVHAESAFRAQLSAQHAAVGGGAAAGSGGSSGGGGGGGYYLEGDLERRADNEAARRYVDSLLAEGAAPASRLPLLLRLAAAPGPPDFARALALRALQELLLLSDSLTAEHASTAVVAPLRDAFAPPALRLQAVAAAGAIAARRPSHAPQMLAALEDLIQSELRLPPACREPAGQLAAAAAAAYAEAVLSDSLVISSSAYATLAACLAAVDLPLSDIGAALVRQLLSASPPHVQRKLVVGILVHAPPPSAVVVGGGGGGGAVGLARGKLVGLLPEGLKSGDYFSLAVIQAMVGAAGEQPQLAEACAALLECGGAAPGSHALTALLAHLAVSSSAGVASHQEEKQ